MEPITTSDSFMIIANEEVIPGSISWNNNNQTLIVTPEENLLPSMDYTIFINNTAQDIHGIALENALSITFSTINKKERKR